MKWAWFILLTVPAAAQTITFTNRIATFTNLQGHVYSGVQLVKGDLDGIIWREAEGTGGGRICYTNLDPALLAFWGIPADRIETAKARAGQKAASDAKWRLKQQAATRAAMLADLSRRKEVTDNNAANEKSRLRSLILLERSMIRDRASFYRSGLVGPEALDENLKTAQDLQRHEDEYRAKFHEEPPKGDPDELLDKEMKDWQQRNDDFKKTH
jgi:hypothetical protein